MSASIFRDKANDIRGIFKKLNEDTKKIGFLFGKIFTKKEFQMLYIWLLVMMQDFIHQL